MEALRGNKLIVVFMLLACLAGLGVINYFDLGNSNLDRGPMIGFLSSRNGEVRFKAKGTAAWDTPKDNQGLIVNDAVFVGEHSSAIASLGNSKLEIAESSLVVFRSEGMGSLIDLQYGTFVGQVRAGDHIFLDQGNGQKLELKASENSQFSFKKSVGNVIQIRLESGSAKVKIGEQDTSLTPKVTFKPDKTEMPRRPAATLPSAFTEPISKEAPVIQRPQANEVMEKENSDSDVAMQIAKPASARAVWYQIYRKTDFKKAYRSVSHLNGNILQKLPDGEYLVRAVSVYNEKDLSDWTPFTSFKVATKKLELPWADLQAGQRLVIPNRAYPTGLYHAPISQVTAYLKNGGSEEAANFFRKYKPENSNDRLEIQANNEVYTLQNASLPEPLLAPGEHTYQYRTMHDENHLGPWSEPKALIVSVEAPRKLSSKFDNSSLTVRWTPVLFASGYELQVAENGHEFGKAFPADKTSASLNLSPSVPYTWHVRAIDEKGSPISEYSQAYDELIPGPKASAPAPAKLAEQHKAEPPVRKKPTPAQRSIAENPPLNQSALQKPNEDEKFPKHPDFGWWTWFGLGYDYTRYDQTVTNTGTFSDEDVAGPGPYLELGYKHPNDFGAIVSYKSTPGQVSFSNAKLDGQTYNWTTTSIEGFYERPASFRMFNSSVYYGVRAGFQDHQLPYLQQVNAANLSMQQLHLQTASAGFLSRLQNRRWNYHWTMRYQYPISASASGSGVDSVQVSPKFAFDGSLGISYDLTENWLLGWYWYGQWHEYDLSFMVNNKSFSGSQSLFYSNTDLRLGYAF